jgi:hypothetical protein
MSMLLNLFLLVGAVRQYRQRYQAELELARRAYPPPVAAGADGGAGDAFPNTKAGRAARAREQASQRTENRRERQARIALASPSATLIALRPAAAGPDGGSGKKPAPAAPPAAAAPAEPTEPPQGRVAVGATGGPLAAGFVGLKRPPLGRVFRLWVQRGAAAKGTEPVVQHVGLIVVDGRGRANVLFEVPTGAAVTRAELRQEPVGAPPKAPAGDVVLSGDAPAEP